MKQFVIFVLASICFSAKGQDTVSTIQQAKSIAALTTTLKESVSYTQKGTSQLLIGTIGVAAGALLSAYAPTLATNEVEINGNKYKSLDPEKLINIQVPAMLFIGIGATFQISGIINIAKSANSIEKIY